MVEKYLQLGLNGDETQVRFMKCQISVMMSAVDVKFVL